MQHHAGPRRFAAADPDRRGKGAWLVDFDGKRYLDGISSWWTNLFGHANPRINAALREQLETWNTSCSPVSRTSRWSNSPNACRR